MFTLINSYYTSFTLTLLLSISSLLFTYIACFCLVGALLCSAYKRVEWSIFSGSYTCTTTTTVTTFCQFSNTLFVS